MSNVFEEYEVTRGEDELGHPYTVIEAAIHGQPYMSRAYDPCGEAEALKDLLKLLVVRGVIQILPPTSGHGE